MPITVTQRPMSDAEKTRLLTFREGPTLAGWLGCSSVLVVGSACIAGIAGVIARVFDGNWASFASTALGVGLTAFVIFVCLTVRFRRMALQHQRKRRRERQAIADHGVVDVHEATINRAWMMKRTFYSRRIRHCVIELLPNCLAVVPVPRDERERIDQSGYVGWFAFPAVELDGTAPTERVLIEWARVPRVGPAAKRRGGASDEGDERFLLAVRWKGKPLKLLDEVGDSVQTGLFSNWREFPELVAHMARGPWATTTGVASRDDAASAQAGWSGEPSVAEHDWFSRPREAESSNPAIAMTQRPMTDDERSRLLESAESLISASARVPRSTALVGSWLGVVLVVIVSAFAIAIVVLVPGMIGINWSTQRVVGTALAIVLFAGLSMAVVLSKVFAIQTDLAGHAEINRELAARGVVDVYEVTLGRAWRIKERWRPGHITDYVVELLPNCLVMLPAPRTRDDLDLVQAEVSSCDGPAVLLTGKMPSERLTIECVLVPPRESGAYEDVRVLAVRWSGKPMVPTGDLDDSVDTDRVVGWGSLADFVAVMARGPWARG